MSKQKHDFYDVIIVGAGMVGATLGCALGRQGMDVLLLDRTSPKPYVKTEAPDLRVSALNLASANIMHNLNVWQRIENKRFYPFTKMQVWEELKEGFPLFDLLPSSMQNDQRFNQTTFDCKDINQLALGYIVENRVLQLSLHEQLITMDNVTLTFNTTVETIQVLEQNIKQVELSNGLICNTKLLIGADGAQSKVRQLSHIGINKKEYEQHALVATVELKSGPLDTTWQAFVPTGPMALLPLSDCNNNHYASLVFYHHNCKIKRLMSLSDPAFLSELIACFPDELPEIKRLHQKGSFPLIKQHAQQYVKQGIALVGDAAHTVNPLAGQGVNMGLLDAAELSEVIIDALNDKKNYEDLDNLMIYQQNRRANNRNMAWILDAFYHGFSNESLPLKLARNAGLALVNKLGPVAKYIEEYGAGLKGRLPSLAKSNHHPS